MTFLVHIHSVLAWLLVIGLLASIAIAFAKKSGGKAYSNSDRLVFMITMILTHTQLIIGGIQYFLSQKVIFGGETMSNAVLRFFTVEHPFTMILAIAAITIGYSRSKRALEDSGKFKQIYIWYGVGLLLALLRFPWKYLSVIGKGWFV